MRLLLASTTVSAIVATTALTGCSAGGAPQASRTTPAAGAATSPAAETSGHGCSRDVAPRPLPTWARAGFSPPTQPMPYVLGDDGDIVAILWADHDPLAAPPRQDRNNKILWASPYGGTLRIEATRDGSDRTVVRTVPGGPGPSIIDLPAPGCWSFDLTWGGHHDHLRLAYAAG